MVRQLLLPLVVVVVVVEEDGVGFSWLEGPGEKNQRKSYTYKVECGHRVWLYQHHQ